MNLNNNLTTRIISLLICCWIFIILTSCGIANEFTFPAHSFRSKNISSYKIKKLALLPIVPDSKDSSGTYYSTNYFVDLLSDEFPNLEIANIDDIRNHEIDGIPNIIKDIKQFRIMDHRKFLNTNLGFSLNEWGCDAIIVGCIDSTNYQMGWVLTEGLPGISKGRKTLCYFSYFLISMKDGRVLWKGSAKGTEIYLGKRNEKRDEKIVTFPPVDLALINGLEILAEELPKETFIKKSGIK